MLLLRYIFVCLTIVLVAAGKKSIESMIEDATNALKKGQLDKAINLYTDIIRKDKSRSDVFFRLATAQLAKSRHSQALQQLDSALKIDPDFEKARWKRDELLMQFGNVDRLSTEIEKLLKKNPSDSYGMDMRTKLKDIKQLQSEAKSNMEWNDHEQAILYWTQFIELAPMNHEARVSRGDCYLSIGRRADAIADVARSINLKNDNTEGYLKLSKLYYDDGQAENTLAQVRHCLQLDQEHKECKKHYTLVRKLNKFLEAAQKSREKDEHDVSVKKFEAALKLISGNIEFEKILLKNICMARVRNQEDVTAKSACEKAIEVCGDDAELYIKLGETLVNMEDYDAAIQAYRKAKEIDPDNKEAQDGEQRAEKQKKQANKKDYYKILGVKRNASNKQITAAYRKLARQYHPDSVTDPAEKEAMEKKFIDIAHAKEVLTDEEMRRKFDSGVDPLDPEANQGGDNPFQHGNPFGGFHFHQRGGGGGFRGGGGGGFGGGGFGFH